MRLRPTRPHEWDLGGMRTRRPEEREPKVRPTPPTAPRVNSGPRTGRGRYRLAARPTLLNLRKHGTSGRVLRGGRRTFLIRNSAGGGGGIFQRFGSKGRSEVRLLFALVPRVSITPDLDFLDTVTQIVNTRFADRFFRRFDEAVLSAR